MFAGLDVGGKRTTMCVVHEAGKIVWRGIGARLSSVSTYETVSAG
jgi:hypothetical protein